MQGAVQPQEFFLKPGFIVAHSESVLVRCVLGSCCAVTMYDRELKVGGINHYVWPRQETDMKSTVVYGEIAIPALCRILEDLGARRENMEAQIFGGGTPPENFGDKRHSLGDDNLDVARSMLKRLNIPVVSEDVGGCKGRKLVYNTETNEIAVVKVDKLRATDWYDYDQDISWDRV